MKPKFVLAIESAVSGGSIALTCDGTVIAKWHSSADVSRSEELLMHIAELLERSGVDSLNLSKIVVSNGPGSYTGIRIGLATAMGLARALEIPCVGVSLLKALNNGAALEGEKVVVVPIGRSGYCWQFFDGTESSDVNSGNLEEFSAAVESRPTEYILAHNDVFEALAGTTLNSKERVIDLGRDLAVAVAIYADSADDGLEPFYARDIPIKPLHGTSN